MIVRLYCCCCWWCFKQSSLIIVIINERYCLSNVFKIPLILFLSFAILNHTGICSFSNSNNNFLNESYLQMYSNNEWDECVGRWIRECAFRKRLISGNGWKPVVHLGTRKGITVFFISFNRTYWSLSKSTGWDWIWITQTSIQISNKYTLEFINRTRFSWFC